MQNFVEEVSLTPEMHTYSRFLSYYLLHDYDKRVKEKLDEHPGKRDGTRSEIGSMKALPGNLRILDTVL